MTNRTRSRRSTNLLDMILNYSYGRGVNLYGLRVSLTDFCDLHGLTMQSLRIFMIFADSNLQSFHALYSNCCQFAMTPAMLREHESK